MLTYWSIFWRTFSALELAVVTAAMTWDWASDFKANAAKLMLLTVAPFLGALGAAFYAAGKSPAVTAIGKAVRAFFQAVGGGIAVIGINSFADVIALPNLLVPLIITAVLSFAVTFFSAQGTVPPATTSP